MLLLLQIILCCLLYLALVKCAVRDSGRNCLYFYPDAYLDEAQRRGIADKTEGAAQGQALYDVLLPTCDLRRAGRDHRRMERREGLPDRVVLKPISSLW